MTPESIRILLRCAQASETLARTRRIVNRLRPLTSTPHGFYEPEAFLAHIEVRTERNRLHREVQPRIAERIRARDEKLSLAEMEAIISRPVYQRVR